MEKSWKSHGIGGGHGKVMENERSWKNILKVMECDNTVATISSKLRICFGLCFKIYITSKCPKKWTQMVTYVTFVLLV